MRKTLILIKKNIQAPPHENVRRAAYIFDPFADGMHTVKSLTSFGSTHPTIKERLQALGFVPKK